MHILAYQSVHAKVHRVDDIEEQHIQQGGARIEDASRYWRHVVEEGICMRISS